MYHTKYFEINFYDFMSKKDKFLHSKRIITASKYYSLNYILCFYK